MVDGPPTVPVNRSGAYVGQASRLPVLRASPPAVPPAGMDRPVQSNAQEKAEIRGTGWYGAARRWRYLSCVGEEFRPRKQSDSAPGRRFDTGTAASRFHE